MSPRPAPRRFALVGIDHAHVLDHLNGLRRAGALCVAYCPQSTVPALVQAVAAAAPEAEARERDAILEDPTIDIVCINAVPNERAGLALRAMRAGKHVLVDKPGLTTFEQLAQLRQAVADTGRRFTVCFSERLCVPAAAAATRLVRAGAIGRVIHTTGLGPHRKGAVRPDWFWRMQATGGILVDIASHQIDQFLHYTGADTAEVAAAAVGNFGTPEHPGFEDFGELLLHTPRARGYLRVDWFTPGGLPTWGDGRLTLLGTEGFIELRKYIDIAGRPGGNHLFMSNHEGTTHHDCSAEPLPFFAAWLEDLETGAETAITQAHVFEVCRLALEAQRQARRLGALA